MKFSPLYDGLRDMTHSRDRENRFKVCTITPLQGNFMQENDCKKGTVVNESLRMKPGKSILLLFGLLILSYFWNFQFFAASGSYGIFDWRKDIFLLEFHFRAIKEHGEIPLGYFFIPEQISSYPTLQFTGSVIANPEVLKLSLASVLVFFFHDAVDWFRLVVFLHFIPGALGILLLARRSNFSWSGVFILFALTLLNPWLLQHLAIGFLPWVNLGWMILAIGVYAHNPLSPSSLILSGAAAAMILWQGGLHLFVWLQFGLLAFLSLYQIFAPGRQSLFLAFHYPLHLGTAILLSFPFLWGGASVFGGYAVIPQAGLRSLMDLYQLLTDVSSPLYDLPAAYTRHNTNFYDGSLVMGKWFVVILVGAAITEAVLWIRGKERNPVRGAALACSLVFVVLAFGTIWRELAGFFPLLSSEKYPWRFLFIALLFCVYFLVSLAEYLSREYLPARYRLIVLILLFLPIVYATYQRNQLYNRVATASPGIGAITTDQLSYREDISKLLRTIKGSDPPGAGSVNAQVFLRERDGRPCLKAPPGWQLAPAGEMIVAGGQWDRKEKNCLRYDHGSKRITLTFRDYGFSWAMLLYICLILSFACRLLLRNIEINSKK